MGRNYTHVISTVWITYTHVFSLLRVIWDSRTGEGSQRHRMVINRPATMRENPMRKFHEFSSAIQCRT